MTVATWLQTNFAVQTATVWKTAIDGNFAVSARLVDAFAVRERATPIMKVDVDAGWVFQGTGLTEVAVQTSGTITAPVTNPRIDYVVADRISGAISIITGVENASPVAPAITSGKVPLATILLATSTTTITNSLITDKRAITAFGRGLAGELNIGAGLRNDGANNLQVSLPSATPSTNQTLNAGNHLTQYKNTAPITYSLPRANTLWVGYEVDIYASGGAATLSPNVNDGIGTIGAGGGAYTVPTGADVKLYLSGAGSTGQWDIRGQTESGVTAGSYTLVSVTFDKFGRATAASSGASSSGNFNKISSGAIGSTTLSLTGLAGRYKLILDGLVFTTGTTNGIALTVSTNGGATYLTTGYAYSYANDGGSSYAHAGTTGAANIPVGPSIMNTSNPSSIEIDLFNMNSTVPTIKYSAVMVNSSGAPSWVTGAAYNNATVNAIRLTLTNLLTVGNYTLYQLT